MKTSINKNTRYGLIVLLTLLLLGSAGLTAWWFQKPAAKNVKAPVYTCTQTAQVDYRVLFDPNNFFPESAAAPGRAYITPLTQYIETIFNYQFSGKAPADISGTYRVDAALIGYLLKEKEGSQDMEREKVKVWAKSWPLVAPTPFSAHDSNLAVKQVIPIDVRSCSNFADQVAKQLKFSADIVELTVSYQVLGSALTPEGQINQPLNAALLIPIDGSAFTVGGTLTDNKEKSITKDVMKAVPGVKSARTGLAVATGLFVLLLLLVIFKTKAKIESQTEKELRMIINKYGDRIVEGIIGFPALLEKNTIVVQSFADLVKVADEVEQPILYENIGGDKHSFYVINEPLLYHYVLEVIPCRDVYENQFINKADLDI